MWATASSPASRVLVAGWAVFAAINAWLMFLLPGQETIPFHFIWISFAVVHGLRPWRTPYMLLTLAVITGTTFWALLRNVLGGAIRIEETTEVPLMAGLFLVMVWHVNRRQASLRQVEQLAAIEHRRAEAQQLFVRLGSHELRTPITVARGYTELIRAAHPDAETDEDTAIVLDELAKLERITARLLTLMLVDSAMEPTTVDLDEELERIIRRWEPTATRNWSVDSRVGSAVINIDRLETALDSLLENAVKFTADDDVVSLRAWSQPGEFLIEVRDGGRGIAPDELSYVFDHFATGRTAGAAAGTGLGLPIVRATIAARGGVVEVSSTLGEGTSFLLRIPEQPPVVLPEAQPFADLTGALQMRRRATDRPMSPA